MPSPVRILLATRTARAVADGLVVSVLAVALERRGLSEAQIGAFVAATLLGSAALVTLAGLRPDRLGPVRVLGISSVLMVVVGLAFAAEAPVIVLAALAVLGPLNPSGGDVSAFLPAEQALAAGDTAPDRRTAVFARFSLAASVGAALGAFAAGVPDRLQQRGWTLDAAIRLAFLAYAGIGVAVFAAYRRMSRLDRSASEPGVPQGRLGPSRRTVRDLAILFSLDAAGGGFVVSSLLALWLLRRFDFDLGQIGGTLALMSLMSAVSALSAPLLVVRFGPVRTMVFTHLPAQVMLFAAALAPSAGLAVVFLALRSLTSSLDVPARTAFVMNVVTAEERAAAASFTNVPRSLAGATTPALAGWMLGRSSFGWPLVAAALCKCAYDVLLLVRFGAYDRRRAR